MIFRCCCTDHVFDSSAACLCWMNAMDSSWTQEGLRLSAYSVHMYSNVWVLACNVPCSNTKGSHEQNGCKMKEVVDGGAGMLVMCDLMLWCFCFFLLLQKTTCGGAVRTGTHIQSHPSNTITVPQQKPCAHTGRLPFCRIVAALLPFYCVDTPNTPAPPSKQRVVHSSCPRTSLTS